MNKTLDIQYYEIIYGFSHFAPKPNILEHFAPNKHFNRRTFRQIDYTICCLFFQFIFMVFEPRFLLQFVFFITCSFLVLEKLTVLGLQNLEFSKTRHVWHFSFSSVVTHLRVTTK